MITDGKSFESIPQLRKGNMFRKFPLKTSILALVFCTTLLAAKERPPNIILIMADDIAYDNIGCYGSDYFQTPSLDNLAADGMKFNHCYSEPVCTPSRVKIMTGRDGIRNYVEFGVLDHREITFGTMMKKAGYATAIAGKWQLRDGSKGSLAPDCGFDTYCLWNYPGTTRNRFWNPSLIRDGKKVAINKNSYGPDICTDFLIEFIRKNSEHPFFAYYPMLLVHSPFVATPDSENRGCRDINKNYHDMVNYMDKCVGKIVDALDENGLRENTIVMFTTDNGTGRNLKYPYMGEIRRGEKAYSTDGGTHAPLIVNCPGLVPNGGQCDALVDFYDVLPTLADIGGASLPQVVLDGRSFWPQCRGEKGDARDWIFQYYYPKFLKAAEKHGQGLKSNEIVWAQNQHYKLYRDGSLYAVADRYECKDIQSGTKAAEAARRLLQTALDSMPSKATKLLVEDSNGANADDSRFVHDDRQGQTSVYFFTEESCQAHQVDRGKIRRQRTCSGLHTLEQQRYQIQKSQGQQKTQLHAVRGHVR